MALHQFVCCITVMTILLWKGCHSQQPACGRNVKNNTEGEDASPGIWPWHVTILTNTPEEYVRCGGSLIASQWVLTAALCTPNSFYNTVVYLGRYNQSGLNPNEVTRKVEDIICHPIRTFYLASRNDICLVKLSAPVNFTDYIQPICLASENSTFYNGTSSWVTDFDYNGYGLPNTLKGANVPILGNNECSCYSKDYQGYYSFPKITENFTCTGPKVGWTGLCFRDRGQPLMTKTGSVWVQSGVLSYSSCGGKLVYIRVSQYQRWISDTVTGTPPGSVTFTSPGTDSDLNFTCPTSAPTTFPTTFPTTLPTTFPTTLPVIPTTDDSVFGSGENLIHFTHFTSLCVLVVLLHVFVGN